MNRENILKLQKIVDGQMYHEPTINNAIQIADSLDVSVALKALKGGYVSEKGRFTISQFIVDLLREQNNKEV